MKLELITRLEPPPWASRPSHFVPTHFRSSEQKMAPSFTNAPWRPPPMPQLLSVTMLPGPAAYMLMPVPLRLFMLNWQFSIVTDAPPVITRQLLKNAEDEM
jgi:hypothetical protein